MSTTPELETRLREAIRQLDDDWTLDAGTVSNDEYFPLEEKRLWGRSWVFLAHESEIPQPGDYVVRYIGENSFIVTRDEDNTFRAHLNACRHRGMMLCRAETGNSSHFRCPYHGWTYSNRGKLVGVPAGKQVYGDHLDKSQWGLESIPQLAEYKGLIFGCLDRETKPLDESLGDMRFYLDTLLDRTDGGLAVAGPPQRWIVDTNWKLGAENFTGDSYHLLMTHRSLMDVGYFPNDPNFIMFGEQIAMEGGHASEFVAAPPGVEVPPYLGLPEQLTEQMKRRLLPEQMAMLERAQLIVGNVFPNLTIGNFVLAKDLKSPPSSFTALRLWRPLAQDKTEVWSWCLIPRDAPEDYRKESYEAYVRSFGSGGVIEQDDVENWRSVTRTLKGSFAQNLRLNYQMGRGKVEVDTEWPGPGVAYNAASVEGPTRGFHRQWLNLLANEENVLRGTCSGTLQAESVVKK